MSGLLENKYINLDDSDRTAVLAALERRQLAGTAAIVKEYEQALANYFDIEHALAVSSGTGGIEVLLYAFDIGEGDEVILPPTAPIMSAVPILAVGAIPIFADVQAGSFSFDIADLKSKITSDTRAILSVPMWGYPTDITEVMELAKQYGIHVIEDASHCHGARGPAGLVGTVGDAGVFSTQERKLVATGEGGFILTHDQDIADRIGEVRDFGKPLRKNGELKDHLGQYGYLFGLNFRLSALSAALGIAQLAKLESKIAQRAANAAHLRTALAALKWLQPFEAPEGATPNHYASLWLVDHPQLSAEAIGKKLFAADIVSDTYRFGIQPLYRLPLLAAYASACPNAESLLARIITLPTHEGLSEADLQHIITTIRSLS